MVSVKYILIMNVSVPSSDFTRSVLMTFADGEESFSLNNNTRVGKVNTVRNLNKTLSVWS